MKKLAMVVFAAAMSFGLTGCIDELFGEGGGSCSYSSSCSNQLNTSSGYYCSGGTWDGYCYGSSSYCNSEC